MALELALKRALVPAAIAALAHQGDVVCEVLPEVGEYVLGDRRKLTELVARVAAEGVEAARGEEVHVRVARQQAGFALSDTVIVSVSIQRGNALEDIACVDIALPVAGGADEGDARVLAASRVLVVVPTMHAAHIHASAVRRHGGHVESFLDGALANERMRAATASGAPFDVLLLDDQAPHFAALLREATASAIGRVRSIVATAVADGPLATTFATTADQTLTKPVLPRELCEAIAPAGDASLRETSHTPLDRQKTPPAVPGPRESGLRDLRLAALLTQLAVGGSNRRAR